MDKAELAVQEVQIRSLLKVIDGEAAPTDIEESCSVRMVTEGETDDQSSIGETGSKENAPCDHSAACYDLTDVYDRTDRIPVDTSFYSEDLVKRYIRSITVKVKHLVVKFKAGVEVRVQV